MEKKFSFSLSSATLVFSVLILSALASAASCEITMTGGTTWNYGPLSLQARVYFQDLPETVETVKIFCNETDSGKEAQISRLNKIVQAQRLCSYPEVDKKTTFLIKAQAGDAECSKTATVESRTNTVEVFKKILAAELSDYFGEQVVFSPVTDDETEIKYKSNTLVEGEKTMVSDPSMGGYGIQQFVTLDYSFYLTKYLIKETKRDYAVSKFILNESVDYTGDFSRGYNVQHFCVIDGAHHYVMVHYKYGTSDEKIDNMFQKIFDACYKAQYAFLVPVETPTPKPTETPTPVATAKPTEVVTVQAPSPVPTVSPQPKDDSMLYAGAVVLILVLLGAAGWYYLGKKNAVPNKRVKR